MPNPRPDAGHDGDYEGGFDPSLDRAVGRLLALARDDLDPDAVAAAEESLARGEYAESYLAIVAGLEDAGELPNSELRALVEGLAGLAGG